uniref:Uncharacterized protein n=1 Tax=Lepeophtheirus salmonis TaxID=72036 RepID=A0A0K2T1L2_LEPSM
MFCFISNFLCFIISKYELISTLN